MRGVVCIFCAGALLLPVSCVHGYPGISNGNVNGVDCVVIDAALETYSGVFAAYVSARVSVSIAGDNEPVLGVSYLELVRGGSGFDGQGGGEAVVGRYMFPDSGGVVLDLTACQVVVGGELRVQAMLGLFERNDGAIAVRLEEDKGLAVAVSHGGWRDGRQLGRMDLPPGGDAPGQSEGAASATVTAVWPNPARGEIRLCCGLWDKDGGLGPVRVFDVRGRLVAELEVADGKGNTAIWDGRDRQGGLLPSGVYFAVFGRPSGGRQDVRKFTLIR